MRLILIGAVTMAVALAGVTECATSTGATPPGVTWSFLNMTAAAKGAELVVTATGRMTRKVHGGAATLAVLFDGVSVFNAAVQTCGNTTLTLPGGAGNASLVSLTCPAEQGSEQNVAFTMTIPAGAPSGEYSAKLIGAYSSRTRSGTWHRV